MATAAAVPSMRHSKLTSAEAAMLAGEMKKPSWESKNEGIHERVSFEDSIWGFDLAGGSYYKTPLRVTRVKEGSRAEKAGIRPGDKLKRINDIDTSTLTIQEAHEIIIESGIHLRIAVSAPDDEEDAYFCYEDPLLSQYDPEEDRRRQLEEFEKRREVHAKTSSYWSLMWPWVSKRRIIYRESNCFQVPSKYEKNHGDKLIPLLSDKTTKDDIELNSKKSEQEIQDAAKSQANGSENISETDDKTKNDISNGSTPNGDKDNSHANFVQNNGKAFNEKYTNDDTSLSIQTENKQNSKPDTKTSDMKISEEMADSDIKGYQMIKDDIGTSYTEDRKEEMATTDSKAEQMVESDKDTSNIEENNEDMSSFDGETEDDIDISNIEEDKEDIAVTDEDMVEEEENMTNVEESSKTYQDTDVNTDDEILDDILDTSNGMTTDDEDKFLNDTVSESEPLSGVSDSR